MASRKYSTAIICSWQKQDDSGYLELLFCNTKSPTKFICAPKIAHQMSR